MAAKITKKKAINITAILNVNEESDKIILEIEGTKPRPLSALLAEFNGEEVSIAVSQSNTLI